MGLSKSKFMAGWQCLKRLYLEVHQPELAGEPDEQSMAVFEQGYEVGRWAHKVFPGGVLIEAGPEEMGVAEGSEAGLTWGKMVRAEAGSNERRNLRNVLLAYCKQDTLVIVRLLEVLRAA